MVLALPRLNLDPAARVSWAWFEAGGGVWGRGSRGGRSPLRLRSPAVAPPQPDRSRGPGRGRGAGRSGRPGGGRGPPGGRPPSRARWAPRPTSTRLPTMLRTMWCRKLSAEMSTPSRSRRATSRTRAHRADGRAPATGSGAEGGEVVLAAEQLRARRASPPTSSRRGRCQAWRRRNGSATAAPVDHVEIALPRGRAAGIEARGRRPRVGHPHGVGQERVERALQPLGGEAPVGGEAGDLAEGVDPRVGAAGPRDLHG